MSSVVDELRQFKIFAQLEETDLEEIARIAHLESFGAGDELTTEGAPAERLYLFVRGRAAVKVRSAEEDQLLIDQLGPGELLGWGAVMEPHVYVASAWATEPSEAIVVPGEQLRDLCEANPRIGYQVVKGMGEVMSRRFGRTIGGHGIADLRRFRIFEGLDPADLTSVMGIARLQKYDAGEQLTAEGAAADLLYLFASGKADVKVLSPDGEQVPIDELGPGEILGWGAVVEPHIYTASAWATEPCEVIALPGDRLRGLCEENKRLGYQVGKGIGEVISRRFGRAIGGLGDLREKDLRAFGGEERVVWDNGEVQLTTAAVLIGMGSDSPDVIPLEAVYEVEVEGDCVKFHVHGGDTSSPPLEHPEQLVALVRDELRRTRLAHRRGAF